MIDYEYTSVIVEQVHDPNDDETWVESSLCIDPKDDKVLLTYRNYDLNPLTIAFEFYIEDWRDAFETIVEKKIHLYHKPASINSFSPRSLKIQGNLNPLVNMIIFACISPQSAKLSLSLIDCSQEQLELLLASNNNLSCKSAVKYSDILDNLLDKAFLRVKHLIDSNGLRLSQLMKIARKNIALNQKWAEDLRISINAGKNKVVFSEGSFLVVEVIDQEEFDNIFEPVDYAVIDYDNTYDYLSGKFLACATGKKYKDGYSFDLTFSHVDCSFLCDEISEVPKATFRVIQSYMDMTS